MAECRACLAYALDIYSPRYRVLLANFSGALSYISYYFLVFFHTFFSIIYYYFVIFPNYFVTFGVFTFLLFDNISFSHDYYWNFNDFVCFIYVYGDRLLVWSVVEWIRCEWLVLRDLLGEWGSSQPTQFFFWKIFPFLENTPIFCIKKHG